MKRPWVAIIWFGIWGLFQAFAVSMAVTGNWKKPEAFPGEAYKALIYPDMFFIPLYLVTSVLLLCRHWLGYTLGLISGGAVIYVMIYLLALSGLKGIENLMFDSIFLFINIVSVSQIVNRFCIREK